MQTYIWQDLADSAQQTVLTRPVSKDEESLQNAVKAIIAQVKQSGDNALKQLTAQFDKVELTDFVLHTDHLQPIISTDAKNAIHVAYDNIYAFHAAQKPHKIQLETTPGVVCEKITRAIQKVGLYIPGGSAPLISTVLMLGVPSQIAGCAQVVLSTPPNSAGNIDPHIIYAAKLCGIKTLYKLGGAQAIAAMAYGTESVLKVDKIFGPGNSFVTCAKQLVAQDPAGASIDMPAGPSEVMVIADDDANPAFVAADLLSQAEHGPDSQVILICLSVEFAEKLKKVLADSLAKLPRKNIAQAALTHSAVIVVDDLSEAINIANRYAPEHLIIQTKNAREWLPQIQCAGSIFLGAYTPESVGDYASGTNHVLPTYGFARNHQGLSLQDFLLQISVQELTLNGLQRLGPHVEVLAQLEGLQAHALAVTVRLDAASSLAVQQDPPAFLLTQLARPEILKLIPYSSARREHAASGVYLNANENPYPKTSQKNVHRYPQPQPEILRERLAQLYQLNTHQILMTRGSDEGIDLWLRAFCAAGQDSIMVCPPTYDMYALSAHIQHAQVLSVPLMTNSFALDISKILETWNKSCKLIFLCSPNNPTGNTFATQDILYLCEALKNKAIIIVDEAYIEFADSSSLSEYIAQYPNLTVLRTLSKAYGMAGARCGVVLARSELIQLLEKVISPYPLPLPVVDLVLHELQPDHLIKVQQQVANLKQSRDDLTDFLKTLPYVEKIWPSEANFILFKVKDAKGLIVHCAEENIIIRDRSHMLGLANCVRISIGLPEENQLLKQRLESYE